MRSANDSIAKLLDDLQMQLVNNGEAPFNEIIYTPVDTLPPAPPIIVMETQDTPPIIPPKYVSEQPVYTDFSAVPPRITAAAHNGDIQQLTTKGEVLQVQIDAGIKPGRKPDYYQDQPVKYSTTPTETVFATGGIKPTKDIFTITDKDVKSVGDTLSGLTLGGAINIAPEETVALGAPAVEVITTTAAVEKAKKNYTAFIWLALIVLLLVLAIKGLSK